jgi:hypothetical protein
VGGGVLAAAGSGEFVGRAAEHGIRHREEKVRKDIFDMSPQYGLGIPATRVNPISPLAMSASSTMMADFIAGAQGRKLTRGTRRKLRRGAYQFAGANQMLYSPLGFGRR